MMSEGFITNGHFSKSLVSEIDTTALHIEDQRTQGDSDDFIVRVWVEANNSALYFEPKQAEAFIEAMSEIVERYTVG